VNTRAIVLAATAATLLLGGCRGQAVASAPATDPVSMPTATAPGTAQLDRWEGELRRIEREIDDDGAR